MNREIALVVGIIITMGGILLVLRHLHVWRQEIDTAQTDQHRRFLKSQIRRRGLTSGSLIGLGMLIASLYWTWGTTSPILITTQICMVLVLLLLMLGMAGLDMLATNYLLRHESRNTVSAAQELAKEYHRLRKLADEKQQQAEPGKDTENS